MYSWKSLLSYLMVLMLVIIIIDCSNCNKQTDSEQPESKEGSNMATLQLISTVFSEGELIPSKYTCDGKDISPSLKWSGIPQNTKSLALICDDPDAPSGTWVHWVVYYIPSTVSELSEGVPTKETTSDGLKQGTNDFKKIGYGGPCPPSGTHRYYFKLYALDTELQLSSKAKKSDVEKAMKGHILATGQLMGRYKRK
jgi:Raf kinase inhibitor-like YbhB/YbcL family protein